MAAGMRLLGTIEHFSYLRRSGRVSGLAAFAATKLRVRPLFQMRRGIIGPYARTRGRAEALARIVRDVRTDAAGHASEALHVAAMHANCLYEAQGLLDALAGLQPAESIMTAFTPVMGVHTGPGVCGVAWWWENVS